jgi:hypothetical protein
VAPLFFVHKQMAADIQLRLQLAGSAWNARAHWRNRQAEKQMALPGLQGRSNGYNGGPFAGIAQLVEQLTCNQ